MTALEDDIQTQKRGFVLVMYDFAFDLGEMQSGFFSFLLQFGGFTRAVPRKLQGLHFCSTVPGVLEPIISFIRLSMIGKENRMRFRAHFGTL